MPGNNHLYPTAVLSLVAMLAIAGAGLLSLGYITYMWWRI